MTDYYVQFVTEINNLTEEERAWIQALEVNEPDFSEIVALLGKEATDNLVEFGLGFGSYSSGEDWRISSDESGDVENVAVVVQAFFKKFRPQDSLLLEWANTCSKMMVGAFSGGAVLITAKWVYFDPQTLGRMQEYYEVSPSLSVSDLLLKCWG